MKSFQYEIGDMVMINDLAADKDSPFVGLLAIVVELSGGCYDYVLFVPFFEEELCFFEHEIDLV